MGCHIIFGVNMGEDFGLKSQMVAGGHKITTPSYLTYLSLVYQYSARIALKIAALNDLKVITCDIQNVYLNEKCQ